MACTMMPGLRLGLSPGTRHLHGTARGFEQAVVRRRGSVAQDRGVAAGEDGGQPASARLHLRHPDRIDTPVEHVQPGVL